MQLIDATQWYRPLRKNLGSKNCELSDEDIRRICDAFLAFEETEQSKIFPNEAFGYWKVTVERPLRIDGIDPERAYATRELRRLRTAAAVGGMRRRSSRRSTREVEADPLRGLFPATIKASWPSSNTSRTPTCGIPSRSLSPRMAASKPSFAVRCCLRSGRLAHADSVKVGYEIQLHQTLL